MLSVRNRVLWSNDRHRKSIHENTGGIYSRRTGTNEQRRSCHGMDVDETKALEG